MAVQAVKAVCAEYRINSANISIRGDYDVDDLVDVIEGSRVYVPCIYVMNKIDQVRRNNAFFGADSTRLQGRE